MKVLWITNILFPESLELIGKPTKSQSSGGWLLGMSEQLASGYDMELTVATVSDLVSDLTFLHGNKINYVLIPIGKGNIKYNIEYEKYWMEINKSLAPDIVHIHGTEFSHGLAYIRACGNKNVVVSIQGLATQIANYYYGGLDKWTIFRNISLINILNKNNIFSQKRLMAIRGKSEIEIINSVDYIIGRTIFDQCHSLAINPQVKYYHCNETLRKEFYSGCWSKKDAIPHTIFVSQSDSSIKGLHIVLRSLTFVKKKYPDVSLRITGFDFTKGKNVSNYGRIIKKIIRKYQLSTNIVFLGKMDASQMKQEYLKASVFVCASSIENSSNSISEAQILGVPCVASYVGGTPTLIPNNMCGEMYRYDDDKMLAFLILKAFEEHFDNGRMREEAFKRHDPKLNTECIVSIYNDIISQ